jgi:hypothetical protein
MTAAIASGSLGFALGVSATWWCLWLAIRGREPPS